MQVYEVEPLRLIGRSPRREQMGNRMQQRIEYIGSDASKQTHDDGEYCHHLGVAQPARENEEALVYTLLNCIFEFNHKCSELSLLAILLRLACDKLAILEVVDAHRAAYIVKRCSSSLACLI